LLVLGTAELTRLLVTGFGAAQGNKCSKFDWNGKKTHNILVDKKHKFLLLYLFLSIPIFALQIDFYYFGQFPTK
jgi:hypothetical protein